MHLSFLIFQIERNLMILIFTVASLTALKGTPHSNSARRAWIQEEGIENLMITITGNKLYTMRLERCLIFQVRTYRKVNFIEN